MKKAIDLVLWTFGLVLVLGVALIALANSEWFRAKIESVARERTGREVQLGALHVRFVPHPVVTVDDLRIANPAWAETPHLVDAEEVRAELRWLPLFAGRLVVADLLLTQAQVGLERREGRATWRFDDQPQGETQQSRVALQRIAIDQGEIVFRDRADETALDVAVSGDLGRTGELRLDGKGQFRGHPVVAVVTAPAIVPSPDTPIAMKAQGRVGSIRATMAGRVRAADQDGIDIELELSGDSLADLEELVPTNLPDTPPYRIHARVRNPGGVWTLDDLSGRVGDSDLRGRLAYDPNAKPPVLRAKLDADLLDFDDLGPLVGSPPKTRAGETASPKQKAQAARKSASPTVLPDRPFKVQQWPRMDADVTLAAKRIRRPDALPIEGLDAHLVMRAGQLELKPLAFDFAGGRIDLAIALDGRKEPLQGRLTLDAQRLALARLFPKIKAMSNSQGLAYGRAELAGRGNSVAQLLGTSTGGLSLLVNGGTVSNLVLEAVGLDLAEIARIFATRDPQVRLRCAAADFEVKDGIATTRTFVVDTVDTVVEARGTLDFKREFVDLVVHPAPKDPSPFALRTPLDVTGAFKNVGVRPQAGPLAARGAAAAVLGAVNPLLALVPFIETGPGKDSDCARLAEQVRLHAAPGGRNAAAAETARQRNAAGASIVR